MLPAVSGELHEAVVGTDPDRASAYRRGRNRKDGIGGLRAGTIEREPSGHFFVREIVQREIGTKHAPTLTAILGCKEYVTCGVEYVGIKRIERYRSLPIEAIAQF